MYILPVKKKQIWIFFFFFLLILLRNADMEEPLLVYPYFSACFMPIPMPKDATHKGKLLKKKIIGMTMCGYNYKNKSILLHLLGDASSLR